MSWGLGGAGIQPGIQPAGLLPQAPNGELSRNPRNRADGGIRQSISSQLLTCRAPPARVLYGETNPSLMRLVVPALALSFTAFRTATDAELLVNAFRTPPPLVLPATLTRMAPPQFTVDEMCRAAGLKHGLPPSFIKGVIAAESAFEPTAVSPKGAIGLMQLMPETAREMGATDPMDPAQNIDAGATYLSQLMALWHEPSIPSACNCRLQRRAGKRGQVSLDPAVQGNAELCEAGARVLPVFQNKAAFLKIVGQVKACPTQLLCGDAK